MKALSIRNLPDDVYETLKAMATANHRSMQEQVRSMIERETRLSTQPWFGCGPYVAGAAGRAQSGRYGGGCAAGSRKMIWVIDTSALIRLFVPDGPIHPEIETAFNRAASGADMV